MKHLRVILPSAVLAVPAVSILIAFFYGIAAAIAAFVLMVAAGFFISGWLLFHVALSRKSDKSSFFAASHNAIEPVSTSMDSKRKELHAQWREQTAMEEVTIKSHDGLDLFALVIRNNPGSRRWAVVCHGYASAGKERMMYVAQTFHEMGYSVLSPDARGHGKSGGDILGMGWPDRFDILQWIDELNTRDSAEEIILYGVSMGAATVIMASGEPLPLSVKAIVADSGYASVKKELSYQLKMLYGLPAFPVYHICSLIVRIRAGYWLSAANAVKQIAKSITPVLLIHGDEDTFVPPYMLDELYAAASCPKQKMLIEGAGHCQSSAVDRQRYWGAVSGFLAGAGLTGREV